MSGPQLRTCPVTGDMVLIATERAARPMPQVPRVPQFASDDCPFCPGHEADTPRESYAVRDEETPADGPGWQLRVVPNKFPFIRPLGEGESLGPHTAVGHHELVIETDRHCDPAELTVDEMTRVMLAYRDRLQTLSRDATCCAVVAFRNVGVQAGASLEHPHSQVVALPVVPPALKREWDGARNYRHTTGECVYCQMLQSESRLIHQSDLYAAVCPVAPRFAYETWLLPRRCAAQFAAITAPDAVALAEALLGLMTRLRRMLPGVAFNWVLHTAPVRDPALFGCHWHFKLLPRTAKPAGFEWGTGCFVNAVPPEFAARQLRAID